MLLLAQALLFFSAGDFPLESGKTLPGLRIGYRTYGQLNADKSNAILFPTWFNGQSGDLEKYIAGELAFVDSAKYFVIAVDALGNGVSAPSHKGEFPRVTIGDMVRSQHLLITKTFGLTRLHAVMGISMGAMQAFEWRARYPAMVPRMVSIVGTPRMTARDAMLWTKFLERGLGDRPANDEKSSQKKSSPLESILGGMRQFDAMLAHNATRHFGNSLARFAQEAGANTLLVIATRDEAVSGELPYEFAKLAPSRVLELPGAGHNGYKTAQAEIRAVTLPFLDDALAPAPRPASGIFAPLR